MNVIHHSYWEKFNVAISFALHEILFIPSCCAHRLAAGLKPIDSLWKAQHRPIITSHIDPIDNLRMIASADESGILAQPNACRSCREDIIARGHSGQAHRHAMAGNTSFHDWLLNDEPKMDLYKETPHSSGFEQNMQGLKDAHLQRVEQYWFDHQLTNPTSVRDFKPSCCATVADWERAKILAQEANHRMAEGL